jgi:hypothetical protein
MRNRLIRAYFDIDPDIVWDTTVRDLPPLIEVLCDLLGRLEICTSPRESLAAKTHHEQVINRACRPFPLGNG